MDTAIRVFITSGYWVKIWVFLIGSAGLCYGHGLLWKTVLRRKWQPFALFGIGFVSILAMAEAVGWPFIAFRLSAGWFTGLMSGILIIPAVIGFLTFRGSRKGKGEREKISPAVTVPVLLLLGFAMVSCIAAQKANSDDSFYVSNIALFAVSDVMNPFDSSMGDITTRTVPMYDFQIWEGLMSVPCRIFGFSATEIAHTLVIAPVILACASVFYSLGQVLFRDERKAWIFTGIILLYDLCCRYLTILPGSFLLRRTWQGKTVNINVVVPLLTAWIAEIFLEKKRGGCVLPLLCMLAGVALNPTSLYLNGFQMLFVGVSLAIGTRQVKTCLQLVPALLILALFTLMIYLRTSACTGKIESASTAEEDFFQSALQTFTVGKEKVMILFLIALAALMIWGDARARLCLGLPFFWMVIFLWNPWSGRFVAEKITKTATYWRVFWLLPTAPVIAWGMIELVSAFRNKWIACAAAVMMCAALLIGVNWSDEYTWAENPGNTEPVFLNLEAYVRERQIQTPVLACQGVATVLRQENPEIWLLVAKRHYVQDVYTYFGREEEGNDRLILYDFVNRKLVPEEMSEVDALLRKYDVECVILSHKNKEGIQYLEEHGYAETDSQGTYRVYQTVGTAG